MSANPAQSCAAPAFPCIVCTERGCGAPLCDFCLVAFADAVPSFADVDVKTIECRRMVRAEMARALVRSRDDAVCLESYRGQR